ncbi:PDC sensor domain-containing protein [Halapricum salinum]|nr:methyl-accepting chemotaxis protein [Halapricum salinum]
MSTDESSDTGDESRGGGPMGVVRKITPGFIRRSFAIKFGIALLILGLAVGAVGFVGSELVKDEFRDEVNEQYGSIALQDANNVNSWIRENSREATQLSRMPIMTSANVSRIDGYLFDERNEGNTWGGTGPVVHYADVTNGEIVRSSRDAYDNTSFSELNDSLAVSLDGVEIGQGVVRSEAYVDQRGTVRIAFISPIRDDDENQHAIVYTISPTDFATQSLSQTGQDGVTMVVDGQNRILMEHSGTTQLLLQNYSDSVWGQPITDARGAGNGESVVQLAPNKGSGVLSGEANNRVGEYNLRGENYLVASSKVPTISSAGIGQSVDWVVLVHQNQNTAYGQVESVANQQLIATFVGILFIGVFGIVLGRNTAKAIDRLKGKAEEMEEGNLDVDLYSPRDDQIGRLYQGFANMRDALKQQIEEAEQARKEAEVSRAEAMEMSNYLQEKADEYAEIMQQCASGDLTQRMDPDGENEAMDRIANEFNEMIDELEKTTGQLKSFADEVETAGEVVQTSSESVRDASEQVADSIQKISDDAYDQKERLQEISGTMDEIADDLEQFAAENDVDFGESLDRIEEIATMLSDLTELSEETMAEAENVAGAAEEQAAELNEVTQRAEDLSRYARPLREVLDRFETESEHEFYFPTGPGSGDATMPDTDDE